MGDEDSGPVEVDDGFSVGDVAAEMRARQGAMSGAGASIGKVGRHLPITSIIAIAIGLYMLVDGFGDFRYWLQSAQPRDLGAATTLAEGTDADNEYVSVSGKPDASKAASLPRRDGATDYMPLAGTGAKVWVAITRTSAEMPAFGEDAYAGRILRFEELEHFAKVAKALSASNVGTTVDTTREALVATLGGGGDLKLGAKDRVHVVVAEPDATVQLGKSTFKQADAEKAVADLGFPYIALRRTKGPSHTFVARIPEGKRDGAQKTLRALLPEGTVPASPSHGAQILARSSVHKVATGDLKLDGENISVPLDPKADAGYELAGDKLAPRAPGGQVTIPVGNITAVRVERPVSITGNTSVIVVGDEPGSHTGKAIVWLLVLALVLIIPLRPFIAQRLRHRDAQI